MSNMNTTTIKPRFAFGKNWQAFSKKLNSEHIHQAEQSIQAMLEQDNLQGKRVLDIGSGSGLFSLAAYRLGAKVYSFDYDTDSVACTRFLQQQYAADDDRWQTAQGSVLNKAYLETLGEYDIVYAWGVLHHTGNLQQAMQNIIPSVRENGLLYLSIYNYQPFFTRYWTWIKKLYNQSPLIIKKIMLGLYSVYFMTGYFIVDCLHKKNPLLRYRGKAYRGMNVWYNIKDWIGGWPFEAVRPEFVFSYYRERGFDLIKLKTCAGKHGCNEFVFQRNSGSDR